MQAGGHGERTAEVVDLGSGGDPTRAAAAALAPPELRRLVRDGWVGTTEGLAMGFLQANLVVVPASAAFEFLLFCLRNAGACPLIEVGEVGAHAIPQAAGESDLRTDLPRYRVFRDGELVAEPTDVTAHWREDAVAFLLGCAMTADEALDAAGVTVRRSETGGTAPVYVTNVPCVSAGRFAGPLVVNMRPIPASMVARAVAVTGRYPLAHGAPMHVGAPEGLGISDLEQVAFGAPPVMRPDDVPVFWGCGITPQFALAQARLDYVITHYPGHMYITDRRAVDDMAH